MRRVEAVAPVEAPRLQARLRSLLRTCLEDNRQAWELDAAGNWTQRVPDGEERSTHVRLLAHSWGEGRRARRASSPMPATTEPKRTGD